MITLHYNTLKIKVLIICKYFLKLKFLRKQKTESLIKEKIKLNFSIKYNNEMAS